MTDGNAEFDEKLLSGFIDGALTQGEAQKVRLHLEENEAARELMAELRSVREASLATEFPADDQWDERPRGPVSRVLRDLGLLLLLVGAVVAAGLAFKGSWMTVDPSEGEAKLSNWVVFAIGPGVLAGSAMVLVSVVLDRWRVAGRDRYRGVRK